MADGEWAGEGQQPEARQAQLDFGALNGSLPPEFFVQHFCRLFISIHDLVRAEFGTEDLDGGGSPWAGKLSRRFCLAAAELGRPGMDGTSWDALLRDGTERMCLLQGVVARLLDVHVLQDGLFGSSAEHQATLKAEDEATLEMEGRVVADWARDWAHDAS